MMKSALLSLLIAFAVIPNRCDAAPTTSTFEQFWSDMGKSERAEKSEASQRRLDWWRDARFGMFIHWDPSSVGASEISWSKQFYDDTGENLLDNPRPSPELFGVHEHREWLSWFKPAIPKAVYDNLYKSFYPGMFNADEFVGQAKAAGMKYIVQVSKHHNGFCMWDTKFSDYGVMQTPFKRDILGEMAAAAERAGLKFGIYYSQRDWHHPDYGPERMDKYNKFMFDQIREMLTKYPNISLIFFDCEKYYPSKMWDGEKLFRMIHELRPDIVINDRCGVPGDFSTPEQKIGGFNLKRDWESCMTFTGFWSWHGFQAPVIPYEECLKRLVACAGGNGNLLMNVGPMPTGQIDPREADRMKRIGEWLKVNGESIYGTRGGPYMPGPALVSTRKGNSIYLHVLQWNGEKLVLPALPVKVTAASLLGGGKVEFTQDAGNLQLTVAKADQKPVDTVIKLELSGPADDLQPMDSSLSATKSTGTP